MLDGALDFFFTCKGRMLKSSGPLREGPVQLDQVRLALDEMD